MTTTSIVDEIVAIRERWHTKRHPFFHSLLAWFPGRRRQLRLAAEVLARGEAAGRLQAELRLLRILIMEPGTRRPTAIDHRAADSDRGENLDALAHPRLTATPSCAPHVRIAVTSGRPSGRVRART